MPSESNFSLADRLREEGQAKFEEGKFEEAIEKHRKATELNPSDFLAYCSLGRALIKTKKCEEAIKCLKKAIEINPNHSAAYASMGYAQWSINNMRWPFNTAARQSKSTLTAHKHLTAWD